MTGAQGRGGRRSRAGIISLGCSKNLVDTEYLMGGLADRGWSFSPAKDEADLLVVNTCAFLDKSVEESAGTIEEALAWKRKRSGAAVVVAGCMVSRFGRQLEDRFPAVDLFLMPGQIPRLNEWLSLPVPRPKRLRGGSPAYLPGPAEARVVTSGHWAYLKVSDGCDNRCSYCLIPSIRGRYRSRSRRSIVAETAALIEAGVREINLVGQDITRWGTDRGAALLPDLVASLTDLPGEYRLRLLYLHPSRVDANIRRLLSENERVFPYLDIPVQHASDRVLKGMSRPYGRRHLESMYTALRRSVDGIALRTTVMVGFPGEGKREFEHLKRFLHDFPFENLGAFVFSAQEGTPASALPDQVREEEAMERYHEIMACQQKLSADLWRSRRGMTTEALVVRRLEGKDHLWEGRTGWQAPDVDGRIIIAGRSRPGEIVRARITGSSSYDLEGAVTRAPASRQGPCRRS